MLRGTSCKELVPAYAETFAAVSVSDTLKMLADLRNPLFAYDLTPSDNHSGVIEFYPIVWQIPAWTLVLFATNRQRRCAPLLAISKRPAADSGIHSEELAPAECMRAIRDEDGMPLTFSNRMPKAFTVFLRNFACAVFLNAPPPAKTILVDTEHAI